jgi:hypothetical protein
VCPWENHFFGAEIAFYANLQWAKTGARARGACRWRHVDIPAKLTGARHELCTWGEPTRSDVSSLSRKRYTQQYVEHNQKGHCGNKSETRKGANNGGGAVCYGAEKR